MAPAPRACAAAAWESGLACACVACLVFSFSSLQVKLTGGRVPVLQLCVIRSTISWLTSTAVGCGANIRPLFGHRSNMPLLLCRGLFGTAAISSSYVALLNLPLGDAVTLAQMRPPVTAVMARLLLGEPLTRWGALGCVVSLAGVVVLAHPPGLFGGQDHASQRRLLGTSSGLASPVFGAAVAFCIRRIGRKEPALVVALWFHTVTVATLLWPLLGGWPQPAAPVAPVDAALLAGIAASSFTAQLCMTRAYQLLPAARAAAVSFLGVVVSHVLGTVVFHEQLTLSTLAGGVLICVGVLLVTMQGASKPAASPADAGGAASAAGLAADDEAAPLKAPQQRTGLGGASSSDVQLHMLAVAGPAAHAGGQAQAQQQDLEQLRQPLLAARSSSTASLLSACSLGDQAGLSPHSSWAGATQSGQAAGGGCSGLEPSWAAALADTRVPAWQAAGPGQQLELEPHRTAL